MTLHLKGYRTLDDLASLLQGGEEETLFILPSMAERRGLETFVKMTPWSWRRLCDEIFRAADRPERTVVDAIDRWLLLRGLQEADGLPGAFLVPLGDDIRELIRQEVSPERFAHALGCRESCGACTRSDSEGRLCRLYGSYGRTLRERALIDGAALEAEAASVLARSGRAFLERWGRKTFSFVGFLSLTHGQLSLLRRLQALDVTIELFHPLTGLEGYPDAADQLADLRSSGTEADGTPSRVHRLLGGDDRLEATLLCRELALWSSGEGAFADRPFPGWGAIAVVSGTATVEEALRRYRIPYVSRRRRAMAEGTIWKILRDLLERGRDGWPFDETLLLLSSPLLAGDLPPEVDIRHPQGLEAWRESLDDGSRGRLCLEAAASLAESVGRGTTATALLAETVRFLGETLAAPERMARLAGDDIELDEEARSVNGTLKELTRRLDLVRSGDDRPEWSRMELSGENGRTFLDLVAQESSLLPPLPLREALSLYDDNLPVLERAEVVVLLGTDHRRWPGKSGEGPFLSDRLRSTLHDEGDLGPLHLPTASDRRLAREGLFRRLLASAPDVFLCRALQDDSGRPLEETPLLAPALESGWAAEGATAELPLSRLVLSVREPYVEAVEILDEPWSRPREGPVACLSVPPSVPLSGLDRFRRCPFLYARQDLASADRGLFDSAQIGSFLHGLWQRAWEVEGPLERSTAVLFDEVLASGGELASRLTDFPRMRGQLAERLRTLARRLDGEEGSLAARRLSMEREWTLPPLEIGGVTFRGRCDRADGLDDGSLLLFDYKLGSSSGYEKALQLAAYGLALREAGRAVAGYVYACHGDGRLVGALSEGHRGTVRLDRGIRKDLDSALEEARSALSAMAEAVLAGRFPPDYDSKACPGCPYGSLCRRDELRREGKDDDD